MLRFFKSIKKSTGKKKALEFGITAFVIITCFITIFCKMIIAIFSSKYSYIVGFSELALFFTLIASLFVTFFRDNRESEKIDKINNSNNKLN